MEQRKQRDGRHEHQYAMMGSVLSSWCALVRKGTIALNFVGGFWTGMLTPRRLLLKRVGCNVGLGGGGTKMRLGGGAGCVSDES